MGTGGGWQGVSASMTGIGRPVWELSIQRWEGSGVGEGVQPQDR